MIAGVPAGVPAGVETPRLYFRRHLRERTARSADLTWYLGEAVPRIAGSDEVRLAVEELVDRLGTFLGFTPARDGDADHAVWSSADGSRLVVWVVEASRAVGRVGAGLHTRDRLLGSMPIPEEDRLTCLYVVCGAVNERRIDEAVALRRASRHTRLVTIDALMAACALLERGALAHEDVLALLRPPSALADAGVALAGRAAAAASR